ncbi:hypothetical protein BKA66DRAFT_568953 [Pyrenochaeta sp. MPI-SDFR-AT-0127]|nr:hypothetical protein BKA66DRAFT_568953 [Pyrenochaeta sp. MPI-SDFR-AT-0127]
MVELRYSGATLATTVLVLGGFTLVIFILRLWFRISRRKYDASDTVLLAAVVCGIIQSAVYLILVFDFDHGKLKADIPVSIRKSKWPSKLLFINQVIFKLTTPLCKLSLCLLYRTVCATSTGRMIERTRIAIWATIALIVGVYTSALLVSIFQCQPIRKTWEPKTPGSCVDLTQFRYSTAFLNVITSVMVITLPIPVLLKLKQQRPEIKQLIGLILLGLLHTSLTIARFVIMFYPDPLTVSEPQYGWIPGWSLAVGEMDANILFATLVVMRPAFQAVYHALCPRHRHSGKGLDSSRADSVMDSAIGRFRDAWERRNRKRVSETYILESTEFSVLESIAEPERLAKTVTRTGQRSSMPESGGADVMSQMERGEALKEPSVNVKSEIVA